jgi:hypothetical protein
MKTTSCIVALLALLLITFLAIRPTHAAGGASAQRFEYATIRWGGRDNTHIIRPSRDVEFAGSELMKFKKPDRVDDRSFYMNLVMNALAKDGYEFAGMTQDEIVMRRPVAQ